MNQNVIVWLAGGCLVKNCGQLARCLPGSNNDRMLTMGSQRYFADVGHSSILKLLIAGLASLLAVACSDGGGGGTADLAPQLSGIQFTPNSAAAGLTITFFGDFSFTDPDGDLDGGSFDYTYGGSTHSISLPSQLGGLTSGTVSFQLQAILDSSVGVKNVPCWLVDKAGHMSNIVDVNLTQLWTRQLGTALDDFGNGIATDGVNNVLVTGATDGPLDGESNFGLSDVFVTKYAPDTTRLWTRLLGSSSTDLGQGVAVDSNDNIYLVGSTLGTSFDGQSTDGAGDGFLTRFAPDGTRIWSRIIGTALTSDSANGVAIDGGNNIYVTGVTAGDLNGETHVGGNDAFLVKYDVDGNVIWTRLLGSTGQDTAYGVAVDNSGNVYVAGGTEGVLGVDPSPGDPQVNYDAFVAKYDPNGTLQWVTQLGTACAEWAKGIAVDPGGNVSIAGKIYQCAFPGNTASGLYDAFVARLDSSGNSLWIRQFGTANHDSANSIKTDGLGNIYVTGYLNSTDFTGNSEGNVIFLSKYDTGGNLLWLNQVSTGSSGGNQGLSLAFDKAANVFLTGTLQGQLDGYTNKGGNDVFILKYDANGIRH